MFAIIRRIKTNCLSQKLNLLWLGKMLFCGLIAFPFFLCLWFVYNFAVDVPVFDQWHCVSTLIKLDQGEINWLNVFFLQHGKHMVGVPYLLMAVIAPYTGYDTRVEMYTSVFIMLAAALSLAVMTKHRMRTGRMTLLAVLPMSWLALSLRQNEALIGGVMGGLEHIAVSALCVVTVVLLDRVVSVGWPLFLAMALAALDCFTLGNGVLLLPLGAAQLALSGLAFQKMPRKRALAVLGLWLLFSLASGGAYLATCQRSLDTSAWQYFVNNPFVDFQFFLAFLGNSLNAAEDVNAAIATALVLSAVLISLVVALAYKPARLQETMVAPAMLLAYVLISACLITVGRAHFGLGQATTSRYVCIGYVWVAGLYLLVLSAHKLPDRARVFLLCAMVALMVRGTIVSVNDGLLWGHVRHDYRLVVANLLRNYKLLDVSSLRPLAKNPSKIPGRATFLEAHQWSVFRQQPPEKQWAPAVTPVVRLEEVADLSGLPTSDLPVFRVDEATGKNVKFSGWAVDRTGKGPVGGLVVCVDNKLEIPAAYGIDRPEIARAWRKGSYRRSGFVTSCRTSVIGFGSHQVSFKVWSPDKQSYYRTPAVAVLVLRGPASAKRAERTRMAARPGVYR